MVKQVVKLNKTIILLVAVMILSVAPLSFLSHKANAATNVMYLSASTTNVLNNQEFSVDIRVNSTNFNGVETYLNFPSSIQYKGYSATNSAFPNSFEPGNCATNFCLVSYINPLTTAPTGDVLVARINFIALAGSGSAEISLSPESKVSSADNGNIISTTKQGVTINLASPPTPPTTNQTNNQGTQNTQQTNGSNNNPTTPKPASNTPKPTTPVQASSQNPLPSLNNETAKNDPLLSPQDVKATIVIKDLAGNLVKNTVVKINGKEFKTDNNGKVKFSGKAYGVLEVTYRKDGKDVPLGKVTLVKGATDEKYEINATEIIASSSLNNLPIIPAGISILLLAAGVFSVMRINKIRQDKRYMALHGLSGNNLSMPSVPTQIQTQDSVISPQSNDATTNNPSPTIITPTINNPYLSDEDITQAAKKIVEDK